MADKAANRQILGLDLLRAAAALMVMAHHLGFWIYTGAIQFHDNGVPVRYRWMEPFSWFGFVGVEIFFVLSGFVIAYSARNGSPLQFLRSRITRLYPTAWICATISGGVLLAAGHHGLKTLYLHSLLLSPKPYWIDGSYWTLPIEISFYTIILLLLAWNRFRWLGSIMGVVGVISAGINLYELFCIHLGHVPFAHTLLASLDNWPVRLLLLRYGVFFAIGSLLWLCLFERANTLRVMLFLVLVPGALAEVILHDITITTVAGHAAMAWIPATVWVLATLAIFLSVRFDDKIHHILGHHGASLARRAGLMSYPLYLVHQQAGYSIIQTLQHAMPDTAAFLVTFVLMLSISFVVTWLEKPLQKILRRLLSGSNADKRAPSASLP